MRGTSESAALSWGASCLLAVLAHAAIFVAVLPRPQYAAPDAGSPVVMVEFAPEITAPAPTTVELPPGPPQPEPASEEQARHERRTDPKVEEKPVEQQPAPNPEIALRIDKPEPKEDQPEQEARPEQPPPAALPPPEAIAPQAAAPAPGQVVAPTSKQIVAWQLKLVAHLERFKRYPGQAKPAQGVVNVAFTIDRNGKVLDTRVVKSSGSSVLDAEAMALVHRAQPLPVPSPDAPDSMLSQIAPIRYVVGPHT